VNDLLQLAVNAHGGMDEFQVAYLAGEANWNYFTAPFILARSDADEAYFIAHFDVARGGELPGPGSTRFLAGDDPRMKATIDATAQRLADKRGLVYRYTWPTTARRVRRARSCCARSGWRRHSRARSRRPPVTFERAVASHSARC
jgi:hypothetical protein